MGPAEISPGSGGIPGNVIAMSGTTITGEASAATALLTSCAGAACAVSAMLPPMKTTAGMAATTLRSRNEIVCTAVPFAMMSPWVSRFSDSTASVR
jgi:hypothetical protein